MIRRTLRATAFAIALLPGLAVAPGLVFAPGTAAAQSITVPGQGPALPDSDRAAAIRAQERSVADHREAAAEAADAGGMPQLDFNNPLTISQVVWLFVLFGAFVFIAAQYLLPPVAGVLGERRGRIEGDLDAARSAKAEADAAVAANREGTSRARAQAQAAIADATQSANAEAARRAEVLNARLNEQVAAAETRIRGARDAAMGALREVATDATEALVQRLTGLEDRAAIAAAVGRQLDARSLPGGQA
ncbi:F0F1 ATP synthase subunit B' [Roseomonas sp. BN140053]|uniref:F0F1 ATP synthase subunit B family protein n=1 Tax=Roseomonas sp. BN140053 TaxID=3391898 RepID=UPI0039EAD35C